MTPVLRAQTLSVIVSIVFCLWLADGRAVEVAESEGPSGLERYVASLRRAVDTVSPAVA